MQNITLVTGNKAKAKETESILGFPLKVLDIDLAEIQETNLEKIALHKLEEAFRKVKAPVIVDDVGLYINAWGDFPGPFIKWILKASGGSASLLLKLLEGEKNRSATARLAIGYHDGKKSHIFIGETEGSISREIRGENGFGWDPVFIPKGFSKTYAEMTPSEKKEISHRRRGLDKLKNFLDSQKA